MKKNSKYSLLIAIIAVILWGLIPRGISSAAVTDTVTIRNIYQNFIRSSKVITIEDARIGSYTNKKLDVNTGSDAWGNVTSLEFYGNNIVQAVLDKSWDITQVLLSGTDTVTGNPAQVQYRQINENNIPEITSIETPEVGVNEEIIVNGPDNLAGIVGNTTYSIRVGSVTAIAETIAGKVNQIRLRPGAGSSFAQGIQDITITHTDTSGDYTLENIFVYKLAVKVVGELSLNGITMFPTMGEPGSEVQFRRDNLQEYDVYFISDLNKPSLYVEANRAKNFEIVTNPSEDDVITVTVPNISPGPYYVVLTNASSRTAGVVARYILPGQQYTVINVSQQPTISNVEPDRAPSQTPTEVTIYGNYLAGLNLPGFTPDSGSETTISYPIDNGLTNAEINYGAGTLTIGGASYSVNVTRKYEVYIGQKLAIASFNFTDDTNIIKAATREFSTEQEKVEQVKIIMTTTITGTEFNSTIIKQVIWADSRGNPYDFTYMPSSEKPQVDQVIPGIIPIEQQGTNYYINSSINELQLAIRGSNFLVTRYTDSDGKEQLNYPKVTLGGVVINNNVNYGTDYRPVSFQVLKDDVIVDGTASNQVGDTILISVKGGSAGLSITDLSGQVIITNPIRNSANFSAPYSFPDKVSFELTNENDFPIISTVTPNLVAIEGGVNVMVSGNNLRTGAAVYIDGKAVTNIKVASDNKSIQFTAPAGREGETLLQVQNPGGGIAAYPFIYTTTYTDPKIISVQPAVGTTGTAVTVTGDAFLPPDATVAVDSVADIDQYLIYRLIGTRILMNGYDINEYNLNNNRIQLTPYFDNGVRDIKENIFVYRENYDQIELGQGFNSVILFDEVNKKFYRISRNIKNGFAIEGQQKIGDTIQQTRYEINYDQDTGEFTAALNGHQYDVTQATKGKIEIADGLELSAYTPYRIEAVDGFAQITGNRVFITDPLEGAMNSADKLVFEVPDLSLTPWTGNGLYDITVINPDTKSVTKAKAFEYFAHSVVIPLVTNVEPAQGPDRGGNIIKLTCPEEVPADYADLIKSYQTIGFVDTAGEKTRVFIGGNEAASANVIISPDGKELSFRVPAYGESLDLELTDRITVPIVLVNPDGGTFSITNNTPLVIRIDDEHSRVVYGYTYVKPTSNPRIVSISPKEGLANGGYIAEIFGTDFRDFMLDSNGNVIEADLTEKAASGYNPTYDYLTSPLLPAVYFGMGKAELLEYNTGYLQVLVPPGSGTVDVYVVNNDAGISSPVKFKYLLSNPKITSISPTVGKKRGGYIVDIAGSGFEKNTINLLSSENIETEIPMAAVKVGNLTNQDVARENDNSGVILSSRATVTLAGGLVVRYNAADHKLTVTIEDFDRQYAHEYVWPGDEAVFINTLDLKTATEETFPYEQLIGLQITDNRLLVDAGYAPEVLYHNANLLSVTMPGYYTVGTVPLTVINPDGGTAAGNFEYKNPDSNPVITNLSRDSQNPEPVNINGEEVNVLRINYQGNSVVSVMGNDFRENAQIQISDILTIQPEDITYTLPDKLTFTMPMVDESLVGILHRVAVINEDGGVALSDQLSDNLTKKIFIQFTKGETTPAITALEPDMGPVNGGTVIKISGTDFRARVDGYSNSLQVYLGEKQAAANTVNVINYKTIRAITPAHSPGATEVRVENPDGEISSAETSFTYISNPKITSIVDPLDGSTKITTISALGNQEIKIKGSGFMEGARVVFNPVTTSASEDSASVIYRIGTETVDGLTSNILVPYTLESGTEGTEVIFIDEQNITVKTPAGKIDSAGIIVINPDQGASEPYGNISYDLPEVDPPTGVVAEIIEDEYNDTDRLIKVNWTEITGATAYEVYVVVDGDEEFIGSTALTTYVYENLRPDTSYRFIVKTVGDFGSSPPSARSNRVKTGSEVGPPDEDGAINENTEMTSQGNSAVVNIGTDDFKKKKVTIDLTRGALAGCKELVISIPAEAINSSLAKNIEVYGSDYSLKFNPRVFRVAVMKDKDKDQEAGVRFKVTPYKGSLNLLGGNDLSAPYAMEAQAFVGQNQTTIDYLTGSMDFCLDYDTGKAGLRRLGNITLNRYNESGNKWEPVAYDTTGNAIEGFINRLGCYVIIGNRR